MLIRFNDNLPFVTSRCVYLALAGVSLFSLTTASALGQDKRSEVTAKQSRVQRVDASTPTVLDAVVVRGQSSDGQPPATGTIGQPPTPYAGGQVGSGARLGMLGNRSVLETPFNITSYTEELIRNQNARYVSDVVLNDPSVRNDASTFSERDRFMIRGFELNADYTLFDGLENLTNSRRVFTEGVERVEVLKGPSALISGGQDRIGGTINIVPKRAADEPLTRLTTTYMGESQFSPHFDIGRRFGADNEWGVRVNGSYRGGDTVLDNNANKVFVGTIGLDYRGDRLRASLDVTTDDQKVDAATSLFNYAELPAGVAIPDAPNGRRNTASPFEYYDTNNIMTAARVEYDLTEDVTVYAAGGVRRYRENFVGSYYNIKNILGDAGIIVSTNPQQHEGFSAEVGLRAKLETEVVDHQLNIAYTRAGTENYRTQKSRGRELKLLTETTNIYNPAQLDSNKIDFSVVPRASNAWLFSKGRESSIAVSDTLSFDNDRYQLTIGGRFQNIESSLPSRGYSYTDSRFSPAIAGLIGITDKLSVYGNYVEALTAGETVNDERAINNGDVLPPSVNKQKEIGLKQEFGDFVLTTSLFEIRRPSLLFDRNTKLYSASGLQINRGLEVNVFGELTDDLRLLGGVTFLNAKTAKTRDGRFDGNEVSGVPRTAINLYAEYDVDQLISGLTMTGRMIHSSSTWYDAANTQKVKDWTRFDAGLRYVFTSPQNKPVVLKANVENVFDKAYWASSARDHLIGGAPRTFMLSASVDF